MNHLTLCSSSNHLLYPCFLLYCKVHVSFITFILEDEHELSLGISGGALGRARSGARPTLARDRKYGIRIVTLLDPRCIAGWSKRNRKSGKGDVQSCVLVIGPLARLDLGLNIALERTLVSTDRASSFLIDQDSQLGHRTSGQ